MWTFTTGTVTGVSTAQVSSSMAVVQEAANFWGRYIDFGSAVIDITVNFIPLGDTTLAQAGTSFRSVSGGLIQADTILELTSGIDRNGSASDIDIDINADTLNANQYFFGLLSNPNVPSNQFDLFTVLLHEIGHGLGFLSFFDQAETAVFDTFVSGLQFTGPAAVAAFGGQVPLDTDPSHLSSSLSNYVLTPSSSAGTRKLLREAEVRILQDIGLPILQPTNGNDSLFGFADSEDAALLAGNDFYDAGAGHDSIQGGAGNDTILGGLGNDSIAGNSDDDQLFGHNGNDTLDGAQGVDLLDGGAGNDLVSGGDGDDTLIGGAGADTIEGLAGTDTADYGTSSSAITIDFGAASQIGGDAQGDTLTSIENIIGSAFNDRITGDSGSNLLAGGAGADTLIGGAGFDDIRGEDGNDFVSGGAGDDSVRGLGGNDRVYGDDGNDTLFGHGGNDILEGRNGDDFLKGDAGNDFLIGGAGSDSLQGNAGNDTADYRLSSAGVTVSLAVAHQTGGDAQGDVLVSIENVFGSQFSDTIGGNAVSANKLLAFAGDDTLLGTQGGSDTLDGGAGDDTAEFFRGAAGTPSLTANLATGVTHLGDVLISIEHIIGSVNGVNDLTGDGGANLLRSGVLDDTLAGGAGNDTLQAGAGNDNAIGDAGNDRVAGGAGNDTLRGANGNDRVFGEDGNDTLFGNNGNDVLEGRDGADFMKGDAGTDYLLGGDGIDSLFGGAGNDVFVFENDGVNDFIGDWSGGAGASDRIQLKGYGTAFDTFAEVFGVASQVGSRVIIDFGGGETITLLNTQLTDLHQDDFIFV